MGTSVSCHDLGGDFVKELHARVGLDPQDRRGFGQALELGAGKGAAEDSAEAAVRLDPEYSAAWKALGLALTAAGRAAEAERSYERGIAVAERRGDQQAAKEMRVFSKRLHGKPKGA